MAYLIVQILWFLVAAAAIGFAVGWLSRSLALARRRESAAMQSHATQGELEEQRQRLEAQLAEAAGVRKALEEEIAKLRETGEADAKTRRKLEREHSSALIKLEAREREVARLAAGLQAGQSEAADRPAAAARGVPAPLGVDEGEPDAPPLAGPPDEADDRKPLSASGRPSRSR